MAVTNGYADGDDLQVYLNAYTLTLSGTSKPTLASMETRLDQIAAEVDSVLTANGYSTVPATGTNDVLVLGRYVAMRAAFDAWTVAFGADKIPDTVKAWRDEYEAFITALSEKKRRLIDQAPRSRVGVLYSKRHVEE